MLPNIVLFEGEDAIGTTSLWETNGTVNGTFELLSNPPAVFGQAPITGEAIDGFVPSTLVSLDLTVFNNQVLFAGRMGPAKMGPYTLWTSDGTVAGTGPLTIAGAESTGFFSPTVTAGFTVFDDEVLFRGIDNSGAGLSGLWVTNGTATGTTEIKGINGAASTGVNPSDMTVFNGAVLFNGASSANAAGPAGHLGLWTTNGTATGTQELGGSTGISGASATGLNPTDLTVIGNEVLFSGVDASGLSALWVTNGTAAGTRELLAEAPGATAAKDPHGLNPTDLTVFNGDVFFNGLNGSGLGQLWELNETTLATQMLTVPGAAAGISPTNFEVYNGQLLFAGFDSKRLLGLWTTNGTAAGTQEISPSSGTFETGLQPVDLTALTPGAAVGPTIAGTVSGQTTTSEAPVKPFTHVAIGDANVGATDTLTITLGGAGGPLSGTGLSAGAGGVYTLSGTAAAITSELDALIFTPTAGAPNTSSKTTFTLSDLSSANGAPVVDSKTSVIDSDPAQPPPTITSSILFQNTDGQVSIWEMNGISIVGGGPVADPGPSWRAVGTGDFNDDSHSDILLQNTAGQVSVWEMNGNNIINGGPVANPGPSWHAIGTGDFNDDKHSDILMQNTSSGEVSVWEMNGNKIIGGGSVADPGPSWRAGGAADLNAGGHSDILMQNTSSGEVSVWEMNGNNIIGGGSVADPGPSWHAIGTGGGSSSDILLQNTDGQVSIWDMNGNTIIGGGNVANPGPSWHGIGLT